MIAAVSMMKDEADIAPYTVRHLLEQGVDLVLVADNLSTDGTGDLCWEAGAEVVLDPELGYHQARKMTALAHMAADQGADWIIAFDADEMWDLEDIHMLTGRSDVIRVSAYDFLPRRNDPDESNPFKRLRYRRRYTQVFPKVAFRYHPDAVLAMGNHSVSWPGARIVQGLEIRHYQYRSQEQLARKVRQGTEAYEATSLPVTEGAHWRRLAALTDEQLSHAWTALLNEEGLVYDPCE